MKIEVRGYVELLLSRRYTHFYYFYHYFFICEVNAFIFLVIYLFIYIGRIIFILLLHLVRVPLSHFAIKCVNVCLFVLPLPISIRFSSQFETTIIYTLGDTIYLLLLTFMLVLQLLLVLSPSLVSISLSWYHGSLLSIVVSAVNRRNISISILNISHNIAQ